MTMQRLIICFFLVATTLVSCSYNPMVQTNETTGSLAPTAIGAGVGAGSVALLGGSKTMMGLAGLGGGMLGYYSSTLRYDAGGIIRMGGKVYSLGDYIGIYIPTDKIFYPNTAEFTPNAKGVLDGVVTVLQRKPNNNIMISGNTSGFSSSQRELALSTERAKVVSAYLWSQGIDNTKPDKLGATRELNYVGYGDYFPIASKLTAAGLRENSRLQITSYPSSEDLKMDDREAQFHNIGAMKDQTTIVDKSKRKEAWRRCDKKLGNCDTGTNAT